MDSNIRLLVASASIGAAVTLLGVYLWNKNNKMVRNPDHVEESSTKTNRMPNGPVKILQRNSHAHANGDIPSKVKHDADLNSARISKCSTCEDDPSILAFKVNNLSLSSAKNADQPDSTHTCKEGGCHSVTQNTNNCNGDVTDHSSEANYPSNIKREPIIQAQRHKPAYTSSHVQDSKSFASAAKNHCHHHNGVQSSNNNGEVMYQNGGGNHNQLSPNGSSTCAHSDGNSETSLDSGKGASMVSNGNQNHLSQRRATTMVYEFQLSQDVVGLFIGRNGRTISWIERKSGASIMLRRHPTLKDTQICSIEGTESAIDRALDSIAGRFHEIDLTQINIPSVPTQESVPLVAPEIMQLSLPEGVTIEVIISSIVSGGHIFVQQPTHPSFMSLERLNYCMSGCYSQGEKIIPQLPRPIEVGVIAACFMDEGWYRAQVVNVYPDEDECDIRYMDYGGYQRVKSCLLRQIRSDFMSLPFQAVECYLAGVAPLEDETEFSMETANLLNEITRGSVLQARTVAQADDGTPFIELFVPRNNMLIQVNQELVAHGVVRWIEPQAITNTTNSSSPVSSLSPASITAPVAIQQQQ